MAAVVKDIDRGWKRISLDIKKLGDYEIKIGLMGSETADGVSVVDIGVYNEFGTSRGIPPRPFMARTYDENREEANKYLQHLAGTMVDGNKKPEGVLRDFGLWYESKVKTTIRNAKNWARPNAASTISMKGSSSPLIDKGRMINAVKYEIVKR